MTAPTDERRIGQGLDSLCEVVMQTIKELTTARQPISASILRQVLQQKSEIIDLVYPSGHGTAPSPGVGDPMSDEAGELRARLQVLDTQRARLSAQLDRMEEQNARIKEFNKRSLCSFIALLATHDNKGLTKSLNRFKQLLLDGSDVELLDQSLQTIKSMILKEETEGAQASKSTRSESGIWSRLTKRKAPEDATASISDAHFEKLRDAYLQIFAQFHSDLGKEYLESFTRTQQAIRASQSIDQLLAYTEEIIDLIETFTSLINEERTHVISLFTEIGSNLAEVETHFMASVDRSSVAQQADLSFSHTLEGQLQDINDSAHFSKSLEDFKGLVFSRISTIKSALEKKREEDKVRTEEIAREVAGLQKSLITLKDEVVQAQEKAKVLEWETLIDPLTGTHNRRAYGRRILSELERYHRYQQVFSLLLFDLDYFKKVNDQYGHYAGDRCLKEIIRRIKPALRDPDFLARFGGEEFIVILPGTGREAALAVAERLRVLVEKTRFIYQGETIPITISVGVTEVQASDRDSETLFTRADEAVYEAKRAGRNRTVLI